MTIQNPTGDNYTVKQDGIINNGDYLYKYEYFDTTFYIESKVKTTLIQLTPYPSIDILLSEILSCASKSIKYDGTFYQDSHHFALQFHSSAKQFMLNNEIKNAHLCKKHLINIWKNIFLVHVKSH